MRKGHLDDPGLRVWGNRGRCSPRRRLGPRLGLLAVQFTVGCFPTPAFLDAGPGWRRGSAGRASSVLHGSGLRAVCQMEWALGHCALPARAGSRFGGYGLWE